MTADAQTVDQIILIEAKSKMNIAYFLDYYPVFSETFIVREISALLKAGANISIFARFNAMKLKNMSFCSVIHEDAKKTLESVSFFPSFRKKLIIVKLLLYHLYFIFFHPVRYASTAGYLLKRKNPLLIKIFLHCAYFAMQIKRDNIKHIHVHFALEACTYGMITSMLAGVPFSFTVHAHDIFIPDRADFLNDKLSLAKFIVCISEYNKNYLLKTHPSIDQNKMKVIHCGIDLSAFHSSYHPEDQKFSIISVGRLTGQKGFEHLLKACELLKADGHHFTCKIIGEGEERQALEDTIRAENLSRTVFLLGAKEHHDVIRYLKSADLFVLPCVVDRNQSMDGIPVALMEAMANRLPVISTSLSGIPELITDASGILVDPGDPHSLMGAIKKIMSLSSVERKQMGQEGRTIIENEFNLEREALKLLALFNDFS